MTSTPPPPTGKDPWFWAVIGLMLVMLALMVMFPVG